MNPDTPNAGVSQGGISYGGDLIGAAIAAGATIYNASVARKNVKDTNKANQRLADQSYAHDIDMWNKMNAYNDPAAQMARLQGAGLNPNMIYGSGANAAGQAASAPSYNTPQVDYRGMPGSIPILDMLSVYQNFQAKQAQIDNVQAQTDNINARTATEGYKAVLTDLTGQTKDFDLGTKNMLRPYQAQIFDNQAQKSSLDLNKLTQTIKNMSLDEKTKLLQNDALKNKISQQAIDKEIKKADLLAKQMQNVQTSKGISPSDHIGFRVVARLLDRMGIDLIGEVTDNIKNTPYNPVPVNPIIK